MSNTIKIKRRVSGSGSLGALAVGELGVNIDDNNKLYVGTSAGNKLTALPTSGGTLTGTLNAVGIIASSSVTAVGLTTSSGFTLTGGDAYFQGSGGVNFNGGPVSFSATAHISSNVTIKRDNAYNLNLYRPTTGATNASFLSFDLNNNAGTAEQITYGLIGARIVDHTDGLEDGELVFRTMLNGTLATRMTLSQGGNLTTTGALTATGGTISGGLTVTGTANFGGSYTNFGGGYGATGVSITNVGNIQADGTLTVDGATTLTGGTIYSADPVLTIQDSESTVANASATFRLGESDGSGGLNNNFSLKFVGTASGGDLDISRYNNNTLANQGVRIKHDGRFGIGCDPSRPLHVNAGGLNFVAEFESTDDKASILIQDDDTLNYIHSQDGYLSLGGQSSLNASNLNINSTNGSVGIGTTVPAAPLNVTSAYSASATTTAIKVSTVGGYNATSGVSIDFGNDQGNYATWLTGQIASRKDGGSWQGALVFSVNGNSSATDLDEKLRITSSLTTISSDLTVGDGTGNAKVIIDGDSASNKGAYVSFRKDGSQTSAVGYRSSLLGGTSNNLLLYTSSGDIDFYNGGTVMTVTSSGLTVGGSITRSSGTLNINGSSLALNNAGATKTYLLGTDGGSVQLRHNDATKLETTATGVSVSSSGNGKLGINTASPAKSLTVVYNTSTTLNTGESLAGAGSALGVLINNTNTTTNSFAALDFRANDADARLLWRYTASNRGQFEFIGDANGSFNSNLIIKDTGALHFNSTSSSFIYNDSSVLRLAGDAGVKIQTYSGGWQDRIVVADNGKVTFAADNSADIYALEVKRSGTSLSYVDIWDQHSTGVVIGPTSSNKMLRVTATGIGVNCVPSAKLHLYDASEGPNIIVQTPANDLIDVNLNANRSSADSTLSRINAQWNGNTVSQINFIAGDDNTNKDDGEMSFKVAQGGSLTEAIRIAQSGDISFLDGAGSATFLWSRTNGRLVLSKADYQLQIQNGANIWFNKVSSSGSFAIHRNGVGDILSMGTGGSDINAHTHFRPYNNNQYTCGTSANRWSAVISNELNLTGQIKSTSTTNQFTNNEFEKVIQVGFAHGVANQKMDFYWTGTQSFWGRIEVEITDSYSNQNASGNVKAVYGVGVNAGNTIYNHERHYTESTGSTGDNWALSDLKWDSTNSRYRIILSHRTSTGNSPTLKFKFFGTSATYRSNIEGFTNGSVYTSSTTYEKPSVMVGVPGNQVDLNVSGNTSVSGDGKRLFVNSNDRLLCTLGNWGGSGADIDEGHLAMYSSGSETVRIATNADSFFNGGNVGIGTVAPARPLQVSDTGFGQLRLTRDATDDRHWDFLVATSGYLAIKPNNSSGTSSEYITIRDGSNTEKIRLATADDSFFVGGNVGIGSATAPHKLSIFGTGAGNATVQIEGEGGADPYINFLVNNTTHWSVGADDSDSDSFKISQHSALGTNDRLTLTSAGVLHFGGTSTSFIYNDSSVLRLAGDAGVKIQTYSGGWQDRIVIADGGDCGFGTVSPECGIDLHKAAVGGLRLNIHNSAVETASDASISFETQGQMDWGMGIDRSDSGKFKIGHHPTVGSDTVLTLDSNNKITVTDGECQLTGNNFYQAGSDGHGQSGTLGSKRTKDSGALDYSTYWAYDCHWDHDNDNWVANRTSLGRKWKLEMGYHRDVFTLSRFDGTVSSPWTNASWNDLLTVSSGGINVTAASSTNTWLTLDTRTCGYDSGILFNECGNNRFALKHEGNGDYLTLYKYTSPTGYIWTAAANGNFGINTLAPAYKLHCVGTGYFSSSVTLGSGLTVAGNAAIAQGQLLYLDGGSNTYMYSDTADSISIATGGSVRMTLNNSQVSINKEAKFPNNVGVFFSNAAGSSTLGLKADTSDRLTFRTGGAWNQMLLDDNGNLTVSSGNISTSNSSNGYIAARTYLQLTASATPTSGSYVGKLYAYNDSNAMLYYKDGANTAHALHSASDYRLKENITEYSGDDAVALVKAAQVKRFDFKENKCPDEHRMNRVGFLAHELQEVCDVGAVVSLEKDAVDNLGNPRMQSVDYKSLVPVLWAALQDALKRIEDLENK